MHPAIQNDLAQARIADWHRQADRHRMARTARLARKAHRRHFVPGHLAAVLARRVLAVLAAHSPRPPRSQPEQAPKAAS
jgi:hypothetical protein